MVLAYSGLEADETLRTYSTLSALLAASNNEVTNTNYARKTLTDADLSAYSVDTSSHSITLPLPTQTWSSVGVGDAWAKLLVCYDADTSSGTDADILPVTAQDIKLNRAPLSPIGSDITLSWPSGLLIAT